MRLSKILLCFQILHNSTLNYRILENITPLGQNIHVFIHFESKI